jgi:Asp-tRNA(Asn)/Glu-tRNA(Gln) amidotransferase A subunit family amidase
MAVLADNGWSSAAQIAGDVAAGELSAAVVIDDALARIARLNPTLNAFTAVTAERARAKAKAVDAVHDRHKLPLAGVPFAVKNLFDIAGLATVAGSKINRADPPAKQDSPLIERLEAAGDLSRLRKQAHDFDPAVRDRLIAGAMVPASLVNKAQIFRRWYREQVLRLFEHYDAILAPATPSLRPRLGSKLSSLTASKCRCVPMSGFIPSRSRSSDCLWLRCRCRSSRCRSACKL